MGDRTKMRISNKALNFSPRWKAAEWVSVKEMKALHSACILVSIKAREMEYEEFLSELDNQVWTEMSEEVNAMVVNGRFCGAASRIM